MDSNHQYQLTMDEEETPLTSNGTTASENGNVRGNTSYNIRKTADFRKEFRRAEDPPLSKPEAFKQAITKACPCDKRSQKKYWAKKFPVWRIMKKYKWREDIPNDLVSGLTVGIMQLPQGMAYALLAELPPVVGLYMAFFPVLIYFLLGTSRHISMGTVALCSLLTGSVISRFYNPALAVTVLGQNRTAQMLENVTTDGVDPLEVELPDDVKIIIASSVCLLVGVVQLIMGFLRMGFITTYMSDPMIGGFTTGAAVHVGTSQVKYVFGLHIPRSDGVFQIIKTNVPTLIMSIVCMIIIYIIKVQVNQRFKSKMRFPVPVELFVVVAGTLLSHFLKFSENYHMKIVGEIPAGLPTPQIPSLPSTSVYTAEAFIISVVAFSQCVSLAALMAKKHGYSFDANQELIAYGAGNIFGSFFSCYPYAASVSRSSVQESAGGKTQLASVFSAIMVLIVIVSIGPLFQSLPNCVLASIIMVALRSLFLQFLDLPKIYKVSAYDFWIWIVTFLAVVVLHVDYGILLGMLFSFFTVVIRSQKTPTENLRPIEEVKVYEDSSKYNKTQPISGVKVVGYNSPIYYANGSIFAKQVYNSVGIIPEKRKRRMKRLRKSDSIVSSRKSSTAPLLNMTTELGSGQYDNRRRKSSLSLKLWSGSATQLNILAALLEENALHHLVIDLSKVTFIDSVGSKILKQLVEDYEAVHIGVLFSGANDEVWRVLEATDFLPKYADLFYITVDDAVNDVRMLLNPDSDTERNGNLGSPDDEQMNYRPLENMA
ncbi:hypothetical protein ACF0H5_010241 [Mactra antiquata]